MRIAVLLELEVVFEAKMLEVGIVVQGLVVIRGAFCGYLFFAGELLVAPLLRAALLQGIEFVHCGGGEAVIALEVIVSQLLRTGS